MTLPLTGLDVLARALPRRLGRPPVRISFILDGSCKTCEGLVKGEMCPPHDASPRCDARAASDRIVAAISAFSDQ